MIIEKMTSVDWSTAKKKPYISYYIHTKINIAIGKKTSVCENHKKIIIKKTKMIIEKNICFSKIKQKPSVTQ